MASFLTDLVICVCSNLVSVLNELEGLNSLINLKISVCQSLESIPKFMSQHLIVLVIEVYSNV